MVADTRQRKQPGSSNIAILALVGYEIVIANSYPTHAHGIIVNYLLQFNERADLITNGFCSGVADKKFLYRTDN